MTDSRIASVEPSAPRLRAAAPPVSKRPLSRGLGLAGVVVIGGWLFLVMQDTIFRSFVPGASLLRLALPILLLGILAAQPGYASARGMRTWLTFFLLVGLLSALASDAFLIALIKLLLYASLVVPVAVAPRILRRFMPEGRGLDMLSKVAALMVFAAFASQLVIGGIGEGRAGFFNNPNQIGMLTVCVMPIFLYARATADRRFQRQLFTFAIIIALAVVVLSRSRTAAAADLAIISAFVIFMRTKSVAKSLVLVGAMATIVLALVVYFGVMAEPVADFIFKDGDDQLIDEARLLKWRETLSAVAASPLLGYGFGLSWLVTAADLGSLLATGRLSTSVGEFGNSTLALLAGGGVILTLVFYGMVVDVIIKAVRGIKLTARGTPENAFFVAMLSGIGGMLLHAQGEGWLVAFTYPTMLFWFFCGLTSACFSELLAARRAARRTALDSRRAAHPASPYLAGCSKRNLEVAGR